MWETNYYPCQEVDNGKGVSYYFYKGSRSFSSGELDEDLVEQVE